MKLTDTSRMPYGKYRNEKMANVPADYLIWLYENNKCDVQVREYVFENLDVLREEIETIKKEKQK